MSLKYITRDQLRKQLKANPEKFKALGYRTRKKDFKDGTHFKFYPDKFIATSYDWYELLKVIKGRVILNTFPYSSNTGIDINRAWHLMRNLKIKIDTEIQAPNGLQDLDAAIQYQYKLLSKLFAQKKGNIMPKIRVIKQSIDLLNSLGFKLPEKEIKRIINEEKLEHERNLAALREIARQKRLLIKQTKFVNETPKEKLDPKYIAEIENAQLRHDFVKKVGINEIFKVLEKEVKDKFKDYELVILKVPINTKNIDRWARERLEIVNNNVLMKYLKMTNPSTGEFHLEGVPNEITTVTDALAWRNGLDDYTEPKFLS